ASSAQAHMRVRLDGARDELSVRVDDEMRSQATVKEWETVAPGIFVDHALASARDSAFSHEGLNHRRLDAEALRNQRGIHTERFADEIDSAMTRSDHVRLPRLITSRSICLAAHARADLGQWELAVDSCQSTARKEEFLS